jgi:hypothetical protein
MFGLIRVWVGPDIGPFWFAALPGDLSDADAKPPTPMLDERLRIMLMI